MKTRTKKVLDFDKGVSSTTVEDDFYVENKGKGEDMIINKEEADLLAEALREIDPEIFDSTGLFEGIAMGFKGLVRELKDLKRRVQRLENDRQPRPNNNE